MSIVITAASGQLGRLVVESLLARGVTPGDIVATARDVSRLEDLAEQGVATVALDYSAPGADVIGRGDSVLLVSGTEPDRVAQHRALIGLAAEAGADRVAYTSAIRADDTTLFVAPDHAATEEILRASGVPFTILRNSWYNENYFPAFEQARRTGVVITSATGGRISSAARRDYADAAAAVLIEGGHEGAVYELGGDTAWTMHELADTFGEALGRTIELQTVSPEEHRQILTDAGLSGFWIELPVAMDRDTTAGNVYVDTHDLSRLIGRPTTPIAQTVRSWV